MSAILKIKQARNPDQIAEALEPLAVSMAALADQLSEAVKNSEAATFKSGRELQEQSSLAASLVRDQAEALKQTAQSMERLAEQWHHERTRATWWTFGLVAMSSTLAAMLSTALWLWLAPAPTVQNTLDPAQVAEHLKPAIQDALKRR
jgi:hypothetical protein